jgi:tetratricopeptide (TPR) repeat protein
VAEALAQRAAVFAARGAMAEAEAAQREAVEVVRAVYRDDHRSIAGANADLASLLQRQGRLAEAAALYEDAIAMYSRVLGEHHAVTALTMTNLAWTEFTRGNIDAAVSLYGSAVPALDSAWADTPRFAPILIDYGQTLNAARQCETAEPMLRRALALERASWPPEHVRVIRAERTLATCLINLRRFVDAEPLLLLAHRKLVALEGPNGTWAAGAASDIATMYELWGRPDEAARFRTQR